LRVNPRQSDAVARTAARWSVHDETELTTRRTDERTI
jgi:hypothetical protein